MKKIKISELPLYQSLKGLFVMGTDVNNRSVKVNLEFIETETTEAVKQAQAAVSAAEKGHGTCQQCDTGGGNSRNTGAGGKDAGTECRKDRL